MVQEGHCYGLIGPNGAGKTTTFSMMCGFLHPSAGEIRILGADPSVPGALKGKVGVLPQDAVLPPNWKVGELLAHWARLSELSNPDDASRQALERVGLPETWSVAAGAMSHGMAKRVAMAQAIMGAPPVILLDEPTAGLDPKIAASVRTLIRELKGKHTVVVSSHNLQELEELCDATALLDKGNLVTAASMADMTGTQGEFRVLLASGEVPLEVLRTLKGCREARLESPTLLVVHFDSTVSAPEDIITQTVALLAQRGVKLLGVTRGQRLEERVLKLT
ncbi:MAG: ABC transporter ATP-binding protein [Myxococcaceae bacterium]|nr:ABC transporter ATP-binding protein [Myxococcaceae bacterium]